MMNFVKKTFAAFCAAVLALGTVTGVLAYESYTLCDDAMLFDSGETQKLEEMMQNLGQKPGWEIVVYTNTNFALLFSVLPRHFSKSFPAPLPDGRKKGACARQGLCAKPAQGGYLCSPCSSTEMTRWVGSCVSVRR